MKVSDEAFGSAVTYNLSGGRVTQQAAGTLIVGDYSFNSSGNQLTVHIKAAKYIRSFELG